MSKKITFEGLRKFNLVMALLHAIQGTVVLFIADANKGLQPITTNHLTYNKDTNSLVSATHHLFDVNLAWFVVAFFFMSALAHLFIATKYRKTYEADLKVGINKARWFEYAFSASTMMVAIGFLSGIFDLSSLIMIFALDFVMNMMGLVMETHNKDSKKPNWTSYIIGCIAGVVPWIVFGLYVWGATVYGSQGVPTFVYYIYGSIFLFFNSFAINMYLQYKKKGKWADYLYGERVYIILSLVAKSALAWQVFAGTLRP
jgi:hypothetical protein